MRVAAADRGGKFAARSLVTRAGELFKADGEVVASAGMRPRTVAYLLQSELSPPTGAIVTHICNVLAFTLQPHCKAR